MTYQQIFIFALLAAVFGMLVWGRIRYDLVAFAALIVGILGGAVSAHEAFAGFGHETTVIIAFVLIISRAMINAGVVEMIARYVVSASRSLPAHIGIMSVIGGALSAVINNVAAIAILMSLDIEAAKKAKRSPSLSLMPLSYATILGGMVTMIGTPSNIVIAQYRERALGEPYSMFSFTPVGLVVAIAGIAFVALRAGGSSRSGRPRSRHAPGRWQRIVRGRGARPGEVRRNRKDSRATSTNSETSTA